MRKTIKNMLFGSLVLGGLVIANTTVNASTEETWQPRTVEQIKADIKGDTYTIAKGDYLYGISLATNISIEKLQQWNNIENIDLIYAGNKMIFNQSESTVTFKNEQGEVINKEKVKDEDKINSNKNIGVSISPNQKVVSETNTSYKGNNNNSSNSNNNESNTTPAKSTNTVKRVTINVDTEGNTLSSTKGYTFVSAVTDKGVKVTLASGNTVTTYTTTKTWKKADKPVEPTNENKYVNIDVDVEGNILTSTDGYKLVSVTTDNGVKEVLENGNTITIYTTTNVWEKIEVPTESTNENKYVTINQDELGNSLSSTEGYTLISSVTDNGVKKVLANGNTITTYTTIKTWKKIEKPVEPTNENKYVTINQDELGNSLSSTEGYTLISSVTDNGVKEVLANGNTITTYTTIQTWKKNYVPTNKDEYVTVNIDTNGNRLNSTEGYTYVSESTDNGVITSTASNGDTITTFTTTVVWKKDETPVPVGKFTVWLNVDDSQYASYNITLGKKTFNTRAEAKSWIDSYADQLLMEGISASDYGVSDWNN